MITETEEVSRVYYPIYLRNLHQYRTSPDNDYDGGWWFRVSTPVYEDYSWFDIPTTSIMETRDGQVLVRANTIYLNRGMVSIETPSKEEKPLVLENPYGFSRRVETVWVPKDGGPMKPFSCIKSKVLSKNHNLVTCQGDYLEDLE